MKRERVVMLSANALSIGITKLSGSKPLLKLEMAIAYAIIAIAETAKKFVAKSWIAISSALPNVVVSLKRDDVME
jgi:hypothetical protein